MYSHTHELHTAGRDVDCGPTKTTNHDHISPSSVIQTLTSIKNPNEKQYNTTTTYPQAMMPSSYETQQPSSLCAVPNSGISHQPHHHRTINRRAVINGGNYQPGRLPSPNSISQQHSIMDHQQYYATNSHQTPTTASLPKQFAINCLPNTNLSFSAQIHHDRNPQQPPPVPIKPIRTTQPETMTQQQTSINNVKSFSAFQPKPVKKTTPIKPLNQLKQCENPKCGATETPLWRYVLILQIKLNIFQIRLITKCLKSNDSRPIVSFIERDTLWREEEGPTCAMLVDCTLERATFASSAMSSTETRVNCQLQNHGSVARCVKDGCTKSVPSTREYWKATMQETRSFVMSVQTYRANQPRRNKQCWLTRTHPQPCLRTNHNSTKPTMQSTETTHLM